MARGRTLAAFSASPAATHHFGAAECEDDAQRQGEGGGQARGEESAIVRDDVRAGGGAAHGRLGDDSPHGHQHEGHNGGDFDEGEPELGLAEHLDVEHVEDEHEGQRHECEEPLGHDLQSRPVVQVEGDGGDIGHDGDGPVQEEEPARDVGALLSQELARVGHESARGGASDRQLAQRPYHEKGEDSAHGVGQGESWASLREASAGAQEESCADRAADGDHLEVAVLEGLVITGVALVGEGSIRRGEEREVVCHGAVLRRG